MTVGLESGTTRRMGRPPLKRNVATVMLSVRLPADVVARIDDRIPEGGTRGEWLRKAIDRALKASPRTGPGSTKSKDAE